MTSNSLQADIEFLAFYVWQDREIRIDQPPKLLELRKGEVVYDSVHSVEDTKGNTGERGLLMITNLRVLWICHRKATMNVTIGYHCIQGIAIRVASSRVRGKTQALCLNCKQGSSKFEFLFTSLVKINPRLFVTIQQVYRAYQATKLYRDLKLRGAIIKDKELLLLPHEQIYSKVSGVWNLSSDQGNIGTMFVTNVRVVWFANMAENFNISIPYIQLKLVRTRESKFGLALVIETAPRSGGYILGFRIDPASKLQDTFKEIHSLHEVFRASPLFGIDLKVDSDQEANSALIARKQDDIEIVGNEESTMDGLAIYYASTHKSKDHDPVFNSELGLAMEMLPEGVTAKKLWSVT